MRKLLIIILFLLFVSNRTSILASGIEAINIWTNTIFPLLFPTFILSDLLIASGIVNTITKYLGKIYSKIFKLTPYGMYIFLISLISGTPTNAKNLSILKNKGYINDDELTRILCTCIFFDPLLIISMSNIKILLILWISNILTGIIMNLGNTYKPINVELIKADFSLSSSIENNINILLNILGTIALFLMLANILPIKNIFLKVLLSGIFEVTNGLNKVNLFFKGIWIYDYLIILILSLGGLSIFIQIKSILKDTSLNTKYFLISRLLCANIGFIILTCISLLA